MKAVIDACVLYPTVLRDLVIGTARVGLIVPIWSERLLEEWVRTATRRGGHADEAVAHSEIALLNARFPEAMAVNDPGRDAQLWLPDPGDIHVLGTALSAGADTIVTLNLKDFPRAELMPHGVSAMHPDVLLQGLWLSHPVVIERIVSEAHSTAERLAETPLALRPLLKRARLPRFAKAVAT